MKIESLNNKNKTSKFIFEVVSNDQDYLGSVLTLAEDQISPSLNRIKEPDAKLVMKSAVSLFPSERQDDHHLLPFHVWEGKVGLEESFLKAVRSSKPSGLGRSSDSYVSGHSLSPRSRTDFQSNEEEEE